MVTKTTAKRCLFVHRVQRMQRVELNALLVLYHILKVIAHTPDINIPSVQFKDQYTDP